MVWLFLFFLLLCVGDMIESIPPPFEALVAILIWTGLMGFVVLCLVGIS
jgi:hypothetical protein